MGGVVQQEVTNSDLFLWALFKLGGADDFVDVEDVFFEAFRLAPNRLSWRTKNLPDLKKCSKGLRDADARRPPLMVRTPDGNRRRLTVEGIDWIDENRTRLGTALEAGRVVQEPKQRPVARFAGEVERSEVFGAWLETGAISAPKWRIAELLKCAPDSSTEIWQSRLEVLRAAAARAEKAGLLDFLNELRHSRGEWFGGEPK